MLRIVRVLVLFPVLAYATGETYQEPSKADLTHVQAIIDQANRVVDSKESHANVHSALKAGQNSLKQNDNKAINQANMYNLDGYLGSKQPPNLADRAFAAGKTFQSFKGKMPNTKKPYVLVSFSMPDDELKALIVQADQVGAVVSVRGLYKDNFVETMKKIKTLSTKENIGGLTIDPTLFQRFHVNTVPTFLLPVEDFALCTDTGCPTPDHIKATGSSSFKHFLQLVKNEGHTQYAKAATDYLSKL